MNQLNKLLNLGIHDRISKNEQKLVRLLNLICTSWYALIIAFVVLDLFFSSFYEFWTNGIGHGAQFIMLMVVQWLHHKKKITAARLVFLTSSMLQFFAFSNIILPGKLIEFYYIIILIFTLLFLHKRVYHFIFLFGTIAAFFIPNEIFHYYDKVLDGNHIAIVFLFLSVFLLVNYFKTVNKNSEQQLEEQKNEAINDKTLIETQKSELEELHNFQNQFFVNVAHEIRTPLTLIKGNTLKISKQALVTKQPEIREALENIELQNNKIQRIVDNVLDLAKMDNNNFELRNEDFSFNKLLTQIHNSFLSNFQNQEINYIYNDTTDSNLIITGDRESLERALNNILLNALKYTPKKGNVTIELKKENNNIILEITDNGIGIPNTDITKIFNRFYQVNNSENRAGGSGIGLAFTKEIIEKHNGQISIQSKENEGSTFTITLPITIKESKVIESNTPGLLSMDQPVSSINYSNNEINILLVEDNLEMRRYLKQVLSSFKVTEAINGIEALEHLKTNTIDFIVTDYMMPKMDGYEFISTIKKQGNITPVIMLTARADFEGKMNVLRLGIDDYLTKPFNEDELLVRINNAIENAKKRKTFLEEVPNEIDTNIQTEDSFIIALQAYIEKHCTNNTFGIPDICDHLALSASSLYRKVKSLTGLSPKEFITEVRLQNAMQNYLNQPSLCAKELASQIGYTNYTHFAKLFQERFGKALDLI